MLTLRWYQEEAIESFFDYFACGNTGNPLIALPTGTGKSVVIAEILLRAFAQYPRARVMMATHVKELIEQNSAELLGIWPTAPLGIYSAGLKRKESIMPIIFGGIASIVKQIQLFRHIDLLFIDEAHLLSPKDSSMYQTAIAALKLVNPFLRVVGFTATPYRLKQGRLTDGGLFTDVIYDMCSLENFNRLIAEGYLSPLISRRTEASIDLSNVHLVGGEFNLKELEAEADKITFEAVKETIRMGHDRGNWLAFASGIRNAENIAGMMQSMGIDAAAVHSKLSDDENKNRIRDFKGQGNYKLRCLVNNNKLTTGFNHPPIDLIAMLRATTSPGLWVQMAGRGTRTAQGKINCVLGDFAGNTKRLGPINDPVIPGKPGKKRKGEMPVKVCECGTYNHISARVCDGCGKEFKFESKLTPTASDEPILASDTPIVELFDVQKVVYHLHQKEHKPPSIRVSYFCGMRMFNEWVTLEHSGFAGKRARDWWRQRHGQDPPATTQQALQRANELKKPSRIRVWINTRYPQVLGHEF